VPQSEQLLLTDSLDEASLAESLAAADGYDYTRRIEYTMLSTQKDIEMSDMQMKRASNIPKLHAFATTGYNPAATHFGDLFQSERFYNYTYAGLRLTVPLFHGFARNHELAGSHIRLKKLENSLAQVQRRIDLQVEQSRINLFNNLESLKTQKRNLELAQENVRVITAENEHGIATNVEVTNAEADLKQAQTHYYNTLYQALLSKIDLEKATGTLLVD
jgi:outer membrane protein TolC